ncbi:uncharacterized protein LOC124932966 [Impatiens glandulifera]|uniref:uncharacterized protein LOC124932966 n=1 Tax=Impatiens glandulifera TaxID=253017 RepID=UPI001FB12BF2|nr:uncharacterized protein LOC124932966 [Impatiens glandulifera]
MAKDESNKRRRTDSDKNSTSDPNLDSFDWVSWTQEEQLDNFIRKKLDRLYDRALFVLLSSGYHKEVALQGKDDDVESEEQQDRPQPFKNLELLVDFNLHFMVYILQKYSPNLNRMSVLRSILMTDLNLNRAIIMTMPFDMPSDLNLEDDEDGDNGEKDMFLALETREILDNLNVLDDSVVSEEMKDAMIADLKKRKRWASKKVAEGRRKQPSRVKSLIQEIWALQYSLEVRLGYRVSALSSAKKGLDNAEKTMDCLEMEKEGIKAEMSASKLIESKTKKKCLKVSKEKISKWEQQLVENDAAIIRAQVKLNEANEERDKVIAVDKLENKLALEKWGCLKRKVRSLTTEERAIIDEHMERVKKVLQFVASHINNAL